MKTNIKKIDSIFKDFCNRHALINEYKGAEYLGVPDNNQYPLLWCAWNIRKSALQEGAFSITVPIFVMDLPDNSDNITVAADVEQLAYDFLIEFRDQEDIYNFWIAESSTFEPVSNAIGKGADKSEGVRFDIVIKFRVSKNRCAIPLN
jgi:hypothetical protein